MKAIFQKLFQDQRGTSAIEMGLICALIVLAMMSALQSFSNENNNTWNTVSSKTRDAIASATAA